MITTEPIPYIGYCFAFYDHRSAYSDYFAEKASERGTLLCARDDDRFVGYICAQKNVNELLITYAFTVPEHRGKGIFTALMSVIADGSERNVKVSIDSEHEARDIAAHVCGKLGFEKQKSITVYTYRPEKDKRWESFMSGRGERICAMLTRRGYRTVSFADADADIIRQICESDRSDFGNPFETRSFFEEPAKKLSRELSFAAVKDGKLAAYTLISLAAPGKVIFEQMAEARSKRGTGVIILPFAGFMKAFRESGCEVGSYAIYDSNTAAVGFRDRLVDIASRKTAENYLLNKEHRR